MILRSVELESFGRFRGETFEFRRGINLIIGPNEAGKSTLAESIPAILFGTSRLERFKPWGRNQCVASLVFEEPGRTVHLKRNLMTDDVELVERDDLYHVLSQFSGKVSPDGRTSLCREYRDLLADLLGFDDEGMFRATCFFGHHPQEWSGDELSRKLRTLVGGSAESDYSQILDELLDEHFKLTRYSPWGRDKKREREYELLCQQLDELDAAAITPAADQQDSSALRQRVGALTEELAHDRREYEKGERYIERVRREEAAQVNAQVEASPETVVTAASASGVKAEAGLRAQLTAAGLPENLPRELPELLAEAGEIRQELASLQQPMSALAQREKGIAPVPWGWIFAGSLIAVLLTAVAWWRSFHAVSVTLAAGSFLAVAFVWGFLRNQQRRKEIDACKRESNRLEQQKAAASTRQLTLSERCDALALPSSAVDLVRLQKMVKEHRALLDLWWASDSSSANLSSAEKPRMTTPAPEVTAAAEKTATSAELLQLEQRLNEFAGQISGKEQALSELQGELLAAEGAEKGRVSESELQCRKLELEQRIAVLRQAINLLAAAVDDYSKSHLLRLNAEVSRVFGKLTGGRYLDVRLDDSMLPSIKVDGGSWRQIDRFSRGTVDALYLSLRVALAKVRSDGRILPLMLDDPFVHLDQQRLNKALNLIDLAAAEGQLLLFSHNQDLGKRAARERWHVVSLGHARTEALSEEGGEHAGQLHLL